MKESAALAALTWLLGSTYNDPDPWHITETDTFNEITALAKTSGIESSLTKGEVAPGAAARDLLVLYTLTTRTGPDLSEGYSARLAIALYVNSKMTPELQKHWGDTSDSPLRWMYSGKGGPMSSRGNASGDDDWWVESKGYQEEVKGKPSLLKTRLPDVIAHYGGVVPKDLGGSFEKMKCPFHDDRKPSASISKTYFKCFACEIHGDAIDIVQLQEGLGYKDAVEFILNLAGPYG